jgi:Flp pilus assembly protein TadG
MKKKVVDRVRAERGQSMVLIALVFVGLLALAGLAIDGGYLLVRRRQAQNAADASALAGTRLVAQAIQACSPIDMAAFDVEVDRTINSYAEQNDISDTNGVAGDEVNDNVVGTYVDKDGTSLGQVGETGTLPVGTAGVRVEVVDTHQTFFLPVIGVDEIPSSAPAMALTGVVRELPAGQPLLPIAIPKKVVEDLPVEEWEMHDAGEQVGKFCYKEDGELICVEDLDAPNNAERGWLNLNHNFNEAYLGSLLDYNRTFDPALSNAGCPNNPNNPPQDKNDLPGLPGYASGECAYALPIFSGSDGGKDGDFIHGITGHRASDVRAVYEAFENYGGALAPVFDRAWPREEMVDEFGAGAQPPDGFPNGGGFAEAGGGSGSSYYYHIVGFAAVQGDPDDKNNSIVYAKFEYRVISGGIDITGYSGSGTCTRLLMGIALWE